MDIDGSKRIFRRLGPSQGDNGSKQQQRVCFHWRAGRCDRFPCPFLHRELAAPPPQTQGSLTNGTASSKRSHGYSDDYRGGPRRNTNFNNNWGRNPAHGGGNSTRAVTKTEKICTYWVQGSCKFGDNCRFLHSWITGNCFSLLTTLEGHQKVLKRMLLSLIDKLMTLCTLLFYLSKVVPGCTYSYQYWFYFSTIHVFFLGLMNSSFVVCLLVYWKGLFFFDVSVCLCWRSNSKVFATGC